MFVNHYNYEESPSAHSKANVSTKSDTVPNMSLSVGEILERAFRGEEVLERRDLNDASVFNDIDEDTLLSMQPIDSRRMDIEERHQMAALLRERQQALEAELERAGGSQRAEPGAAAAAPNAAKEEDKPSAPPEA